MSWDIRIGRGVGPLALGSNADEVRGLLGPPESEATDGEGTVLEELLWSYADLALTFVRKRDGFVLDYVHVERPELTLDGEAVLGLDREALFALTTRCGLGAPTASLPSDAAWGFGASKYSRGGECAIYFWMTDGRVSGVQIQDSRV